jgi:hypothetical protein
MNKRNQKIFGMAVLLLALTGCGSQKPVTVPEKALEYFPEAQLIESDSFDQDSGTWNILAPGGIQNGVLTLNAGGWYSNSYNKLIADGQGVVLEFTYSNGSIFELLLLNGEWGTDQHKRFGFYIDENAIRPNLPTNNLGEDNLSLGLAMRPDTTYAILMAVMSGGRFLAVIWDPADPHQAIEYAKTAGDAWAGFQWTFSIGGNYGTIRFDNFQYINLEGAAEGQQ